MGLTPDVFQVRDEEGVESGVHLSVVESSRLRITSDQTDERTRCFQPRGKGSFGAIGTSAK